MDHCLLDDYAALAVRGRDASAFLQGQLTEDMARVSAAEARLAALNTPQGRVAALPWVAALDDGFVLWLPAALSGPVHERLRRYVLRSRVSLEPLGASWSLAGLPAAPATPLGAAQVHVRRAARRALAFGPGAALAAALGAPRLSRAAWTLGSVRAGEPVVDAAGSELWIAQMLNLDLVDAISFSKGCYTGQEIVARTQHLGRIKRRLQRYTAASGAVPAPLTALLAGAEKVGEVVLGAAAGAGVELLAVVALEHRDRPLATADGLALQPAALPYAVP